MKGRSPSTQSGRFPPRPAPAGVGVFHSGMSQPDQGVAGGCRQQLESFFPCGNVADPPGLVLSLGPSPFILLMLQEALRAIRMLMCDSRSKDHDAQASLVLGTKLVFA